MAAPASAPPGRHVVRVQFSLKASLGHGEAPFVLGNIGQLGNVADIGGPDLGGKASGVPLHTSVADYPVWKSRVLELPSDQWVIYGFAIFRGGRFHRWEELDTPRTLKLDVLRQQANAVLIRSELGRPTSSPYRVAEVPDPTAELLRLVSGASEPGIEPGPTGAAPSASPGPSIADTGPTVPGDFLASPTPAVQINKADGVVVVTYRLPVKVRRETSLPSGWEVRWDYDHLLSLRTTEMRVTRVGMVPYGPGAMRLSTAEQISLEHALLPFDCVPVFVPEDEERGMDAFWQETLLPTFHHLMDLYSSDSSRWTHYLRERTAWHHYTRVNNRFRRKVVEVFNEGDMVWIHDLQLMMLPSYLMRELKVARVGFFLHAPFPSSEIFRSLWCREDLLHGMLNADLIGFHLYEYARHFLTCTRRILGLTHTYDTRGNLTVQYNGRSVSLVCVHAGIEPPVLVRTLRKAKLPPAIVEDRGARRMMILSVDELSRLSGLNAKFLAYEELLRRHPHLAPRLVLHQRIVRSGAHAHERRLEETRTRCLSLVARIQRVFGMECIVFEEVEAVDADLESRVELYSTADLFMVTSLRDGLNRLPLEYTFVQHARRWTEGVDDSAEVEVEPTPPKERLELGCKPGERLGLVIASEFVTCMRVLQGALRVNPWRFEELVATLERAVGMGEAERSARHVKDWAFVSRNTSVQWSHRVLLDLKGVIKSTSRAQYSAMGLGHSFRVLGMQAGFNSLDTTEVVRAYRRAQSRVVFLDYGGTLVEDSSNDDAVRHFAVAAGLEAQPVPEAQVLNLLGRLCGDHRNHLFIVSGREHTSFMNSAVAGVGNLGIAAEHGYVYRWPSRLGFGSGTNLAGIAGADGEADWHSLLPNFDMSWTTLVKRIMDVYVHRTNGTYVEVKGCALLWQFRDADPEFGEVQAKELEDHLITALKNFPVVVLRGENPGREKKGGYIEVRPVGVSKGIFVSHILHALTEAAHTGTAGGAAAVREPDFVLCIGDDSSDEFMYRAATQHARAWRTAHAGATGGEPKVFTCTVGKKPTDAAGYVNAVGDVHALLSELLRSHSNRHFSTPNLSSLGAPQTGPREAALPLLAEESDDEEGSSPGALVLPAPVAPSLAGAPENTTREAPAMLMQQRQGSGLARVTAMPRSFSMSSLSSRGTSTGFVSMNKHFASIQEDPPSDDDSDGNFF